MPARGDQEGLINDQRQADNLTASAKTSAKTSASGRANAKKRKSKPGTRKAKKTKNGTFGSIGWNHRVLVCSDPRWDQEPREGGRTPYSGCRVAVLHPDSLHPDSLHGDQLCDVGFRKWETAPVVLGHWAVIGARMMTPDMYVFLYRAYEV